MSRPTRIPGTTAPKKQIAIPTLTMNLDGVPVGIVDTPEGRKLVVGPMELVVELPFDSETARKVGQHLATGITIG